MCLSRVTQWLSKYGQVPLEVPETFTGFCKMKTFFVKVLRYYLLSLLSFSLEEFSRGMQYCSRLNIADKRSQLSFVEPDINDICKNVKYHHLLFHKFLIVQLLSIRNMSLPMYYGFTVIFN